MKKLFKSHPQQPQRDRDVELLSERPMSPFKAAAPREHEHELDLTAGPPSTLRERDPARDRERERTKMYRNSSASYPMTMTATIPPGTPLDDNWELVDQQMSAPPPPSSLRNYERTRKLSLGAPLSPPLPNPHSPFPGHPTSRTSSMNSVTQGGRDRERDREYYPNPHLNARGPGTPPPPSPYSPTSPTTTNSSGGVTPTGTTGTTSAHGHTLTHAGGGTARKKSLPPQPALAQSHQQPQPQSTASSHGHGSVRNASGGGGGGVAGTAAILRALDPSLGMFGGVGGGGGSGASHAHNILSHGNSNKTPSLNSDKHSLSGGSVSGNSDGSRTQQQHANHRDHQQHYSKLAQQQQPLQTKTQQQYAQQQAAAQQPQYRSRGRQSGGNGGVRQKSRPRSLSLSDRENSKADMNPRASVDNPVAHDYYVDAPERNHSLDLAADDIGKRRPSLAVSTGTDEYDPTLMDSSDTDSVVNARSRAWKERDLEMELETPSAAAARKKAKEEAARERELAMAKAFGAGPPPVGRDKDKDKDREKEKPSKTRGFLERLLSEEVTGKEKDEKGGKRQWGLFSSVGTKDKERDKEKERPRNKLVRERERERDADMDGSTISHTSTTLTATSGEGVAASAAGLVTGLSANVVTGGPKSPDALARMVGLFVSPSFAAIDWTLALEICERTYAGEGEAKEVARALRKEIKYARAGEQLGAATLWAIMLQNASDAFITQTAGRKFLDVVEDAISSPRVPLVRDRLLEVLGAAVYMTAEKGGKDASKRDGFRSLWRKVKPEGYPSEGMPLSTDNPMFRSKTGAVLPDDQENVQRQLRPPNNGERRSARNSNGNGPTGIIPVEEDIRRLFQECRIGRGNALLLNEALAFATPSDLKEKDIIKEFYTKCCASQELIHTQIPWASSGAERSRLQKGRSAQRNDTTDGGEGEPLTREEKLLADLLAANEELTEALRIYDEIERVGLENEVERSARERSRVEVRGNAQDFYSAGEAHSFLTAPSSGTGASSSRSPSPVSMTLPSHTSQTSQSQLSFHHDSPHHYHGDTPPPVQQQQREAQMLHPYQQYVAAYQQQPQPQPPSPPPHQQQQTQHGHGALPPTPALHAPTNHSHTQLPLAPRPLHGPRSPATAVSAAATAAGVGAGIGPNVSPQPPYNSHSRSSSPAHGGPGSRPSSRISHSRTSSFEPSALANEFSGLGSTFDPAASLFVPGYEAQHPQHYDSGPATATGGDYLQMPLGMSEKAAGKRRMVDLPLPTPDVRLGLPDDRSDGGHSGAEDGGSPRARFFHPPDGDPAGDYYSDDPGADSGGGGVDMAYAPPIHWRTEPHYVYDAAAERTRERIRRGMVSGYGLGSIGIGSATSPGIEVDPL